jgi:hypothetical protein
VGAFANSANYSGGGGMGDMSFSASKGSDLMDSTFNPLEDMGVDLSGWTFPDFWTFDLAGDY